MSNQKQNIYLVNENNSKSSLLKNFLLERFDNQINIFMYLSNQSCMRMMHGSVNVVVLDYLNESDKYTKSSIELRKTIKSRFPNVDVIMYNSYEDTALCIEKSQMEQSQFPQKNIKAKNKTIRLFENNISLPIKKLVKEYGIGKMVIIFLATFIGIGLVLAWIMRIINVA